MLCFFWFSVYVQTVWKKHQSVQTVCVNIFYSKYILQPTLEKTPEFTDSMCITRKNIVDMLAKKSRQNSGLSSLSLYTHTHTHIHTHTHTYMTWNMVNMDVEKSRKNSGLSSLNNVVARTCICRYVNIFYSKYILQATLDCPL